MNIRTKEAVRYLGYGRHAIDERTLQMIQDSFVELEKIVDLRFVYRIFEIAIQNEDQISIGQLHVNSKNLTKNLRECDRAVLLGVTLGSRVDALMRKYSILDMSKAVVIQACATALLEEECDKIQDIISEEIGVEGHFRPRFSPGYGDFSIIYQNSMLQILEASKKIGLTMTDGYMLTPSKSITAIIGISKIKQNCRKEGCEVCEKGDCAYRRSERCY